MTEAGDFKTDFEAIVEGQFPEVDFSRDPVFSRIVKRAAFAWGEERAILDGLFFEVARQHGLSREEASKLYANLNSRGNIDRTEND